MKKNLIKFLIFILLIGGLFVVTGCNDGANQFDDPDNPFEDPEDPQNPNEPEEPENPDEPSDPEYYSKGFTIYELEDADGNLIDGYAVGKYEGSDTEVVIPSTWKEKPIIKISNSTFEGNNKITKVTIPASVQIIGKKAFAECTKLKSVVFVSESELQEINEEAFSACTSLKNIKLPEGLKKIGGSAFYKCTNINELVIPTSVTTIGRAAFGEMLSLQKLAVPFIGGGTSKEVDRSVLGYVFGSTYSAGTIATKQEYKTGINSDGKITTTPKTYYIPESLVEIEILASSENTIPYCAFSGVKSVNIITIPTNIVEIESHAFHEAVGVTQIRYRGSKAQWAKIVGVATDPANMAILSTPNLIVFDYNE